MTAKSRRRKYEQLKKRKENGREKRVEKQEKHIPATQSKEESND